MQKDATRVSLLHTFKHLFLKTNLKLAHHLLLAEKTFVFLKEAIAKRFFFLGGRV